MKKIDININQAQIESYRVELKDGMPEVSATIALYAGLKKVSTFSVSTQNYYNTDKIELPVDIIEPIVKIAKVLEVIVIMSCRSSMAELPISTE